MKIERLDHLVLTVRDLQRTIDFYTRVLGMREITFHGGRRALAFGKQKINLHEQGHEIEPKAHHPTPGSADLCFITTSPIASVMSQLKENQTDILEGPVMRTGALGPIFSVYFRDPDQNLIEVSRYQESHEG